jgi:hypothetical protein
LTFELAREKAASSPQRVAFVAEIGALEPVRERWWRAGGRRGIAEGTGCDAARARHHHQHRARLDIGLESSMKDGELIATRLVTPGPFSMTAGVNVPFELEILEPVCRLLPRRVGDGKLSRVAEDRRFAEAVYRVGLATGVMDRMRYLDLADED